MSWHVGERPQSEPFVGLLVLLQRPDGEGRCTVKPKTAAVIIVDDKCNVSIHVLRQPSLHRREAVEQRLPIRLIETSLVISRPKTGHMRDANPCYDLGHDAVL